jgi:DNA-binding NarL/FixJ family response regulator
VRHNGRVPERTRPAIRVLVVDDHPVVRRGLRALLDTLDGIEVVGEASDGETAVDLVQQIGPDVVLMDLHMPGMGGIEATRRIAEQGRAPAVLVMTMFDGDEMVVTAVQAGARGYLVKGAEQDEISRALRAVASGEVIFGPDIAAGVLGMLGGAAAAQADQDAFVDLTGRERDILHLLASGQRTASIAAQLYLAPKTVSNALTSIFAKLQVDGRAEAIVVAREHGFGRDGP